MRYRLSHILIFPLLSALAAQVFAADPKKDIVDGLRAKGDYKSAIEYLEHARTNPALPKNFTETIDYELAITHIDAVRQSPEGERDQHYQLAQQSLKSFLADHAKHALAAKAQSQLGNVLFERGRLQRNLAERREGPSRDKLLETARDYLGQADEVWKNVESDADSALKAIVFRRGEDIKRSEVREEIHRRQMQARLARAWAQYEKGLTYGPASGERAAALQEAGTRFDAIREQQPEVLAGFYARLGRGLCYKELGDAEKAFAAFEELFAALPDDPADFRILRVKAAVQALEIALRPEVKKYKQGLDIAKRWIDAQPPAAAADDFDLSIRYLGAEAATAYVKSLPPPSAEQVAIRARQLDWIRQQYAMVAAVAGPYQDRAKVHLLDQAFGAAPLSEPGSFADARNRAKAALDRMLAAEAEQKASERAGTGNDADTRQQRQQQIASARSEALKCCRQALEKHDASVSGEDLDTLRYYETFIHYSAGELDEAAAEGEAVIQVPADSPAARQTVRLALAARESLFHAAQGDERAMALARLQALAEKMVERWGSFTDSDDARAVLLDLALAEGQLDKAEDDLRQISELGPRRGEAEMAVGQALWNRAQQLMRTSTVEHDHTRESDEFVRRAAEMLSDGVGKIRKRIEAGATAPPTLAGAVLALAQIEMSRGNPSEAIALLENSGAAATGDSIAVALLAYIVAGQLDKATNSLQSLEASLPPQANRVRGRAMIQACVRFQRLLKQHLARCRDRRMDDLLKQTVEHFDKFLAVPADGESAESLFVQTWRAEASAGLAAGMDSGGPAVSPDAEKRYRRAIAAFQGVLRWSADVTKSAASSSAEIIVAMRIDLARCLRRISDHSQALSQLLAVLKEHPLMVDAQLEAAYTYQAWGEDRPEYLEIAIQGGGSSQDVWGWGELARRVQADARFRDVFHESRYNLALCRFRQAQMAAERSERSRFARAAENDILATRRLVPDMGSPVWYDRYNELFKRIQRLADRPAVGLSGS